MRHPRRSITRAIRTRRPKRRGRELEEFEALGWPEAAIRVRDVMTPAPFTLRWDATIGAAWKAMKARRIRHIPVLDAGDRLVGILTDRDLRQVVLDPAIQAELGGAPTATEDVMVREVMTWGVITVRPDADLRQAARIMHEQRIGALPVVERDRVVGILTESDLVRTLNRLLAEGVLAATERWGREA